MPMFRACLLATHDFLCVLFSLSYKYTDSPLKPHALPLLCDMAHASRNSREQLRAHGGLDVYLSLLDDMVWSVTALDSIAVCLAHDNDNHKVEQALLKKDAVQRLVKFFQCCPEQQFVHILEPFLKIITYELSYLSFHLFITNLGCTVKFNSPMSIHWSIKL